MMERTLGEEAHVADQPTESVGLPPGGPLDMAGGQPPRPLPTTKEGDRYVKEVLDPLALSTYESLLTDVDPKIRRQAAADVQEMVGRKGKIAPSLGGITLNLAPDKLKAVVGGLAKVFAGSREIAEDAVVQS